MYIKDSRIVPSDKKNSKRIDYNKNKILHSSIEMVYSAKYSGIIIYKHKNGLTLYSQDCSDSIRPINDNHITSVLELCMVLETICIHTTIATVPRQY